MVTLLPRADAAVPPAPDGIADAIVRTVVYADIFDFAPTLAEIQRYLIGYRAAPAQIAEALGGDPQLDGRITVRDGHATLTGRDELVLLRAERRRTSRDLRQRAIRYARAVGSLPLVEMVAITGALAAGNAAPGADIDLFLVTAPGRLWVTRAATIAIVRYVAREGQEVCPNYLIADTALALDPRDLYGAQELAHLQPVVGGDVYRRLRAANGWTTELLPNAVDDPPGAADLPPVLGAGKRLGEAALRSPAWSAAEAWERRRKIRRFKGLATQLPGGELETSFADDHCKGHFFPYGTRIREAYEAGCARNSVAPLWDLAT